MHTSSVPCPGKTWGIVGFLPSSQLRGWPWCWSLCHAGILPGHRALHPAAGLIFISCFSIFFLSKGRSLYTNGFVSSGSSFVLFCFFNLYWRGHPLFTAERTQADCAAAFGAQMVGFTETILQRIWAKTSSAASLDEFVGDMVSAVVIEEQTCPEGAVLDTPALCCRCPGDNPEPLLLPSSPQETLAELEGWPAGLTGEIALWWRSLPSGVPCMWFEAIFLCPGPLMAMVQYQAAGSRAYFFSWLHLHLHIGGKEAEKG